MTNSLKVQLSWEDSASGERREPRLNLPIALGREFAGMPAEHEGKRVARMLLNSNRVSRYHALIDLEEGHLVVTDQNSSHGILVNGQPQTRCILANGDILQIGPYMITVIFDLTGENLTIPPLPAISHHLSLTDIFPVTSKKLNLHQNGFIVPGIVTVFFVVAMLVTRKTNELFFLYTLAAYLVSASHYLIHKLCHKDKPWWLLLSLSLATGLPLLGGFHISIPKTGNHIFDLIIEAFVGKGLAEELFKALPVLLVYLLGTLLSSPKRELIGIWEPMDGILLGTASATGFALIETMIYVHEEIGIDGTFAGLSLLIPQILGDISGQVAYSGYFGYFIGLSAFKPSKRWQLLGIGYLTSSAIHGAWAVVNIFQEKQQQNLFVSICLAAIGSVAYAFLMAAILKARQFSSNRAHKSAKAAH
jgi:RsiW-degrading membrane proteinase PrsW (M82 family)